MVNVQTKLKHTSNAHNGLEQLGKHGSQPLKASAAKHWVHPWRWSRKRGTNCGQRPRQWEEGEARVWEEGEHQLCTPSSWLRGRGSPDWEEGKLLDERKGTKGNLEDERKRTKGKLEGESHGREDGDDGEARRCEEGEARKQEVRRRPWLKCWELVKRDWGLGFAKDELLTGSQSGVQKDCQMDSFLRQDENGLPTRLGPNAQPSFCQIE